MEIKIVIDDNLINRIKSLFRKKITIPAVLCLAAILAAVSIAATIPHTFESGTTISSSEMNENFDYIISQLNNTGYFDGSSTNLAGTIPGSYTDLDLSSVVGANKALVFLKFKACTISTMGDVYVRSKHDTDQKFNLHTTTMCGSPTETGLAWLQTDDDGKLEWYGMDIGGVEAYVISYFK